MIVYSKTKEEFRKDVRSNMIENIIERNIFSKLNRKTNISEMRSWKNSLPIISMVLEDSEIPNTSGVTIEYNVPNTCKRVDLIISGYDKNNKDSIILIELKQWEKSSIVIGKDGIVKTFLGGKERDTTHPSYQVMTYQNLLKDFSSIFDEKDIKIKSCSFLHNYSKNYNEPLLNDIYSIYTNEAPIFFKNDIENLSSYIKKDIKKGDSGEVVSKIDQSPKKPNKSIQNLLASTLKNNKDFLMVDEQKVVYEEIISLMKRSKKDNVKRTIIIEGGPGTGKTVVALNALSELLNNSFNSMYVTKNSSLRHVYSHILSNSLDGDKKIFNKTRIEALMSGSGSFFNSNENKYDCLIVDEAHRLNEKSGIFKNKGENQIKEIINSSLLSVFFVDDKQLVTACDIGLKENINKIAMENADSKNVYNFKLESQFRMNGSNDYSEWLSSAIYSDSYEKILLDVPNSNYDFRIFDDISDFRRSIESKNENNKSRIVSTYDWEWKSKNNEDEFDIEIGNEKWKWNLSNDATWAISKNSIKQVGCIHTCQGLEFEYCGVIIGDTIDVIDGKLVGNPHKSPKSDRTSFSGIKGLIKKNNIYAIELSDKIIKNSLNVLLTRGMKGTYVYFTNPRVKDYFQNLLKN